ncbi:MAG: hypothetical protein ABSF22_09660 [Bryobacteraceae bacterium]
MRKLFGYLIVLSATVWGQLPSPDINLSPTRQFGHPQLQIPPTQATPNYVEGKEFNSPGQMAIDTSTGSPILYVVDIGNNRVLAFKSSSLSAGHMADLVIGQQDFQSTIVPLGVTTGLSTPTGVAVDAKGNVYIADAGDNRILRFPAPFSQTSLPVTPDLVIGQKTFNTVGVNMGGNCASNTLAFTNGGSAYLTGLAIDGSGNLWTTDPGNNRVLMYPASSLGAGSTPAATMVIGQNSFTSCIAPQYPNNIQTYLGGLFNPQSLAFDASGDLYIADSYSRVLYYAAGFSAVGQIASRVLGVQPQQQQGQPNVVYPTQYTLGAFASNGAPIPPNGVFTNGNHLFVADTPSNRIVEYDLPVNWAQPTTTSPSPAIMTVLGQTSVSVGTANQGLPSPSAYTLSSPYAGVFYQNEMWVADSGNNRVLGFPLPSAGGYSAATAVVGQDDFIYSAPNLIEGREVYLTATTIGQAASAMVIDNSSTPPHLYVSDPGNNRILCFKNAYTVGSTTPPGFADMVIGQPDLKTSVVNYPGGVATQPTQTGLNNPIGVAVDNNGNLYVADAGNGRVVRFPAPFSNVPANETAAQANLVLGQSGFTTQIKNPEANSMNSPWGLALFSGSGATPLAGGLAVSDPIYNRVLYYAKPAGGDFTNGQAATLVFGQSNFTGVTAISPAGPASFNGPRGIAADSSDNLYVADTGNNRIMEFSDAPQSVFNGVTPTYVNTASANFGGFNFPEAVAINFAGELWVADSSNGRVLRFPQYTTCLTGTCAPTAAISTSPAAPLGLALDPIGNVIVGDTFNHLTLFYAEAYYKNAATFSAQQPLAPGMLVVIGRLGLGFDISSAAAQTLPWPYTLGNLKLTVTWPGGPTGGTGAPIFATGGGAIYFQMPGAAPTSGVVNVIVTDATTQAVLGVGQFTMAKADPGFFTANAEGIGPVSAEAYDSSGHYLGINTAANPVPRGGTIVLYLTGQGQVSGEQDGAAPQALPTPVLPTTFIIDGTEATVTYSGLGGGYPGLWQINAIVPMSANPNQPNSIALIYLGIASTIGGNSSSAPDGTPGPDVHGISTTIWVGN